MVFAVLHSHFAPWFSPAQIGGSGGSVRGGADCHALRLRGNQGESDRCVEGLQPGRCEEGQGVATINVPRFSGGLMKILMKIGGLNRCVLNQY